MVSEPLDYRAKKWLVQHFTEHFRRGNQHRRLNDEEWDIVVVLDACRWDTLQQVTSWPIESTYSPGSATSQWLTIAEETRVFEDTYIATGNVTYDSKSLGQTELHKVWETDWNDRLGTVLPDPVLSKADSLLEEGKRPVVAHLIPPHGPYIAKINESWLPAFAETKIWRRNPNENQEEKVSPQVAMASGHIDLNRARQAYKASVESTFEEVSSYISKWVDDDLTVILTADHGETFGSFRELGLCGHPNRCHIDPLVKVPYERFEQAPPVDTGAETVEEKLAALGYVE